MILELGQTHMNASEDHIFPSFSHHAVSSICKRVKTEQKNKMPASDFTVNSPKLKAFSEENDKNEYEGKNKVIENEYMVKNIKSYKKIEKIAKMDCIFRRK